MSAIQWDGTILTPAEAGPPYLMPNNTSGGTGLDGTEEIVSITPPRWAMQFGSIALNSAAKIREWNRVSALAQGRLNPIQIPIFDKQRGPAVTVTATCDGAVAAGATGLVVRCAGTSDNVISEGMFFSSAGTRLYVISKITDRELDGSDKLFTLNVMPPVRDAMADGAALEFNNPVFQVRLASDDAMKPRPLSALRFATQDVLFYEDA